MYGIQIPIVLLKLEKYTFLKPELFIYEREEYKTQPLYTASELWTQNKKPAKTLCVWAPNCKQFESLWAKNDLNAML